MVEKLHHLVGCTHVTDIKSAKCQQCNASSWSTVEFVALLCLVKLDSAVGA